MGDKTRINERLLKLLNVRNLLDNGGFEIWQRGDGPFTNNGDYTSDRWQLLKGGTTPPTLSVNKETTEVKNGENSCKISITVAGSSDVSYVLLQQFVEQYKFLVGNEISVSVWIKTNIANKVHIQIFEDGSSNEKVKSSYHTGSGNWEKLNVVKNIIGDGGNLRIRLGIDGDDTANVTGDIYIDSAMAVIGPEPADFVPTSPAEEWDRCQRFYEVDNAYEWQANSSVLAAWYDRIKFGTIKKATPTVSLVGGSTTGSKSLQSITKEGFTIRYDINGTQGWVNGYWEAEVT
ncbi:MAG: hypothetical protein ACTSPI_11785 [Candidatus Heimdallarchaeaceae archaeon]